MKRLEAVSKIEEEDLSGNEPSQDEGRKFLMKSFLKSQFISVTSLPSNTNMVNVSSESRNTAAVQTQTTDERTGVVYTHKLAPQVSQPPTTNISNVHFSSTLPLLPV